MGAFGFKERFSGWAFDSFVFTKFFESTKVDNLRQTIKQALKKLEKSKLQYLRNTISKLAGGLILDAFSLGKPS